MEFRVGVSAVLTRAPKESKQSEKRVKNGAPIHLI